MEDPLEHSHAHVTRIKHPHDPRTLEKRQNERALKGIKPRCAIPDGPENTDALR